MISYFICIQVKFTEVYYYLHPNLFYDVLTIYTTLNIIT